MDNTEHTTIAIAVAGLVRQLGYRPLLWHQDIFGTKYEIIQINPEGVLVEIKGTIVIIGVEFKESGYHGGEALDWANPSTTEERFHEVVKKYAAGP